MTDAELQQMIVLQVGDDSAGTLASSIAAIWAKHSAVTHADRKFLLAKRDAIQVMLGRVRGQVTFRGPDGSSVNLSDLAAHLRAMLADVNAELRGENVPARAFSHAGTRSDGYAAAAAEDL